MKTLALVTAIAATGHDDDLAPLLEACTQAGLHVRAVAWDDATVSWRRFDAALLRSPWDYTERLVEFLGWCDRAQQSTRLLNPLPVIRWNTDKHYLAELEAAGMPVVPTVFVEPEAEPLEALQAFLAAEVAEEFVVKPAVSAGSRDTQRYSRAQDFAAGNHIARLLEQGRSTMLQPYLRSVDRAGEAALVYFDGQFSHAIGKGALLRPDEPATATPHATGDITPREADPAERQLAESVLSAVQQLLQLDQPLPYARIDLIRDDAGNPRLLELELTEPSLFFAQAPGSVERFAANLARHLNA
jgi:glutathione synthase/RimK-type ligase-like ATP-grasp enzyme